MAGSINLTQSLVQKLGSSIVRGDLPAGKPLPIEAELGKKFGASRTVMREAVKILSTKGLIGQRPRVGTYVHPEEKWDLLDAEVLTWRSEETRLNSSHLVISYAVFCLKKKKQTII